MDFSIAGILMLDGVTNGAIYALLGLATVLIFAVTRVIFIPQGEFVAYGALTLALLQLGKLPGTVWLLLALALIAAVLDLVGAARRGVPASRALAGAARTLAVPIAVAAVAWWAAPLKLPLLLQSLLTLAIVTPLGPLVYRLAFEKLADATVLVLLIVSVGVHFALTGLGLVFFGAEGFRNPSFWDARFSAGALSLSGQALIIFMVSIALIIALYLFFERTLRGKALRATAVNRLGARLMGISTSSAGKLSFGLAAFIGALSGLLIGPTTTLFYDSGFLIGLKGFVAAIFGGLASYPAAAAGAFFVGVLESFGSFEASAFKEVIVFTIIIPVLLWRSFQHGHQDEEGVMRRGFFIAFVVLLALLPQLPVPEFWITQANYVGLYTIVVIGLVLLTGVAGLTSFGQAAFVGIGAYTAAYLSVTHGLSPWVTVWIGLALTFVAALVLGWITLRMSGHYLPLATIAWGLSLYYLLGNLDFLGKYDGLLGVPPISFFGTPLNTGRSFFYLLWAIVLLVAVASIHLLDSRAGRALRAVKGGTTMAEAMGVNTYWVKVTAFVLAALMASVSGWLFAHFQRTVNPSPFGLNMGIEYLFMAVLGGVGHVWGALAGAGIVVVLKDQLQVWLPRLLGGSGNYEVIVFGVLLILVLQYARDGVWAFVEMRLPRARRKVDWTDAPDLPERAKPPIGEVVLDVAKARKEFGGLVAVNDVSFQVRAGEIMGLIGPNGAGKSTTFNLVTGVLPLTRGAVALRGEAVGSLASREIARRGVSRTFQHVKMIPGMTVLENVALGAHLRGSKGVPAAMLRLDRAEERRLLKEAEKQLTRIGMQASLHELAGNLALGPQRLMEIARALCADPTLLLLDEPAAGLRLKEKQALGDVLRQLKREGMAILLVEHDMDLVMGLVDRIVVMEFGTRLIEGTPEEVQASPAVRAAYLGTEH